MQIFLFIKIIYVLQNYLKRKIIPNNLHLQALQFEIFFVYSHRKSNHLGICTLP